MRFIPLLLCLITALSFTSKAQSINGFELDITTHLGDQQTFYDGDRLSFLISMGQNAHLRLIYQDAENNLIQILPSRHIPKSFYDAGFYFTVPDIKHPFQLTIRPPYGKERIWVFATTTPPTPFAGRNLKNGFRLLSDDITALRHHIQKQSEQFLGEAVTEIITRKLP